MVRARYCFLLLLLIPATALSAVKATAVIPTSAPRGARVVAIGTGLDDPGVAVTIGGAPATVVARSATLLEFIVPLSATAGPVRIGSSSFPFTVASDPTYVKVATLVASDRAHDIFKEPVGATVIIPSGKIFIADRMHH